MEVCSSSCSRFRTDSLLSLRPAEALLYRAADPPELCSVDSGCSALLSPRTEPLLRLQSPLLAARLRRLQPRTSSSSFLIRDILSDCRPESDPGQEPEPGLGLSDPGQGLSDPGQAEQDGDYQDRSVSSSDGECRGVGVASLGGGASPSLRLKKPRKARTAFSEQQLSELERSFHKHKYLSVQDRMQLAAALRLSDTQVKTWYQNRRTKWKRQSSVGLELLAEAGRMFLPPHYLYPAAPPTLDLYLYTGHAHQHTGHAHQHTGHAHLMPRLLSHPEPQVR